MLSDFLFIFIVITFICFFLTLLLFIMDYTVFSFPVIMMGMITSILCTYGLWDVEYRELGYNSTSGLSESITTSVDYGDPYGYLFFIIFFIFAAFFIYAIFQSWSNMLANEGMDMR